MQTNDETILREHRLFSAVEAENVGELVRSAATEPFAAEAEIVHEGAPAENLHVVAAGSVELYTRLGGRETSMAILRPPAAFFVAPIVRNDAYPASVRALEAARLIKVPAFRIRAIIETDMALLRALMDELAAGYGELLEALKNQKLRRSVHRVARYLVLQHESQGAAGRITLPVRKQTLASLLGITPSALSRAFTALKPHGVTVHGYEIELSKPYDLRAFANSCTYQEEFEQAI